MLPPYDDTALSCKSKSDQTYSVKSTWEECAETIVQDWSTAPWHILSVHLHTGAGCWGCCASYVPSADAKTCSVSAVTVFVACIIPINSPRCFMLNMNVRSFSSAAGGGRSTIKPAAWIQKTNESEIVMRWHRSYTTELIFGHCGLFELGKGRRGLSWPRSRIK